MPINDGPGVSRPKAELMLQIMAFGNIPNNWPNSDLCKAICQLRQLLATFSQVQFQLETGYHTAMNRLTAKARL
jgi:hypothetical protein